MLVFKNNLCVINKVGQRINKKKFEKIITFTNIILQNVLSLIFFITH